MTCHTPGLWAALLLPGPTAEPRGRARDRQRAGIAAPHRPLPSAGRGRPPAAAPRTKQIGCTPPAPCTIAQPRCCPYPQTCQRSGKEKEFRHTSQLCPGVQRPLIALIPQHPGTKPAVVALFPTRTKEKSPGRVWWSSPAVVGTYRWASSRLAAHSTWKRRSGPGHSASTMYSSISRHAAEEPWSLREASWDHDKVSL